MSWIYLMLAILFEVSGTTCMKLSRGFSRLLPSVLIFVFYGFSFTWMTLAIKKLEVSVVYAVWSGLGTAIIAVIGIVVFDERVTALKIASMVLIIAGVVGLNVGNAAH
jgi:small multidrug resistance pump